MKDQSATPKFGAGRRGKFRHGAPDTGVQAITNAAEPHSEDMHRRMVQYAVTMGIRMVCLLLIFVFDGWFKLVPVVGAVVLPWVAVMIANGGADINAQETVELLDEAPMYSLAGGETEANDGEPSVGDILTGELVPDTDEETTAGDGAAAGGTDTAGSSAAADSTATAANEGAHAGAGTAWPMGPAVPNDPAVQNDPMDPAPETAPVDKRQEEMHHEHL